MQPSRRHFLRSSAGLGAGFAGLSSLASAAPTRKLARRDSLGPLVPDPAGLLDLPEGFSYEVLSRAGETMDDGLLVPARHDGMATFPGSDGTTILVRNHELDLESGGAFGAAGELLDRVPREKFYDNRGGDPCLGGTTTLVVDAQGKLLKHFMSLVGTLRNCAGGRTPWGSWITCEEDTTLAGMGYERNHGYCFEVPSASTGLVDPIPLEAMGRFNHEAIAVDPASGVVYLSEDRPDGLFYRFLPDEPGNLAAGGTLQALGFKNIPSLDTRNWHEFTHIAPGVALEPRWVTLDNVDAPEDDLRHRGFLMGAARFARGEGLWWGHGSVYFGCTIGGAAQAGQVWRYTPSEREGGTGERRKPGKMELFLESPDRAQLEMCDNLCVGPWGGLVLCEDGPEDNFMYGVTRGGELFPIARKAGEPSEFAGSTFSPDDKILFANIQLEGVTVAIQGPWERAGK